MPRTRPAYPPERREQIVALARSGRRVEGPARKLEPCSHPIRSGIAAADLADGRTGGPGLDRLMADEREALRRLRRENRQRPQERRKFETKAEARMAIVTVIEGWRHPSRRHSALGDKAPIEFERIAREALTPVSPRRSAEPGELQLQLRRTTADEGRENRVEPS